MPRRTSFAKLCLRGLEARDVPTVYVEVEPNDVIATANTVPMATGDILTTPANDWLAVQGALGSDFDRDYFRFTLAAPAAVFFDVDSRDTGLSASLDAVVNVYDATGLTLLGNNDTGYDFDGFTAPTPATATAASPDPSLVLDLPAGTYLVRVTSFQTISNGTYELRLLADGNAVTTPPVWHSNAGAAVTLYLDIDGHTATDDWGNYTAAGFDLNGDAATFTSVERLALSNIWRVVAEDFAPFDVDVTTVAPPSFADGVAYRVTLTSSAGSIVGQPTARGASLVGSFTGAGVNTGFVFQQPFGDFLGGVSGRVVAAALEQGNEISRVFGRALGLKNYGGVNAQLSGLLQAPDAGVGRASWSNGLTHSGEPPVVTQDDVAAIAAAGIAYRADDHGDTVATATPLTASTAGLITRRGSDVDVFRFPATMGVWLVRAAVDGYSGNLNAIVRVLRPNGQPLTVIDPAGAFTAEGYVCIPTDGDYYMEVGGGGSSGEVGHYTARVEFNTPVCPASVETTIVNGGAAQRSMVKELLVRFSRTVVFPAGTTAAFKVAGPAGDVPIDIDLAPSTSLNTIAKLRFPNGSGGFGSAPDGQLTLTVLGNQVLADDQQLDGNSDGLPGGNYQYSFHRLFGDHDGDRDVDAGDFAAFRLYFGANVTGGAAALFDSDGDGDIDTTDFGEFRQRFGQII